MARVYFLLLFSLWGCFLNLHAQVSIQDTVFELPPITVKEDRLLFDGLGRHVTTYDSTSLSIFHNNSLSDFLSASGKFFLKDYGPGRLATPSIRGGSAAQTAVLWNGINIQNPMLGQVDFSLIPIQFLDEVSIDHGGSSAFWGSGAINGVVHLKNKPVFRPGLEANFASNFGSFQKQKHQLDLNYATTKWSSRANAFYQVAENDFSYLDLNQVERKLPNSALQQYGMLQSHHFLINRYHALSFDFWWQKTEREIPPTRVEANSVAIQDDESLRSILSWQFEKNKIQSLIKLAWLDETLDFRDSVAKINSESRIKTLIGIWNLKWELAKNQILEGDLSYTKVKVNSSEYSQGPSQERVALSLAYYLKHPLQKWQFALATRQVIVDGEAVPINFSAGLDWWFSKKWKSKLALSRNYRLPTLNSLYWSPGGNPNLQAEHGWSGELGVTFLEKWSKNKLTFETTLFNSQIDNWIIWIPEGSIWTPRNIQQVWSRGWENHWSFNRKFSAGYLKLEGNYTFVRSTNKKTQSANDAIKGKQLIYVPKHQASFGVQATINNWTFHYYQSLTGQVFTLPDNSNSIPTYSTGVIRLMKAWQWETTNLKGYLAIRNLWDTEYEVVLHRPMPGRYYEIGLQIGFKK